MTLTPKKKISMWNIGISVFDILSILTCLLIHNKKVLKRTLVRQNL
ncbi:hypothetical protein Shy_0116 [Escherichia coli phage vB_EcoM_Shy]|uniref:Uncharacterized protein n=1 Tax=Escherichia coli phage vB_EcoM_Shy TaxID=2769805 RepID=A0A7H0XBF4_9CAUD|nr:hypothetical protein Shy_0116 [Escherichia coli phage vB_EcoM_Shy]